MLERSEIAALVVLFAGIPATIAGVLLLPWPLIFGVSVLIDAPLEGLTSLGIVTAGVFALSNYWRLATRTLNAQRYVLGWSFLLSIMAAVVVSVIVFEQLPIAQAAIIVAPIGLATCWLVMQQRRGNRTPRSIGPDSGR